MKKITTFILMCLLCPIFVYCAAEENKSFNLTPDKPKQGETLKIKFNASKTGLENKEVSYIIYSVKNGIMNAEEYPMKKNGSEWEGTYKIPDSSQALGLKFIDASGSFSEQVARETFVVQLFGKNGKALKGTKAAAAYIVGYQGVVNSKANVQEAYKLYKEEFKASPDLVKYYIFNYCMTVNSIEKDKSESIIKSILSNVEKKKELLNEAQITALAGVYRQLLKDKDKSKEYEDYAYSKYPDGSVAENRFSDSFYKTKNDPKTLEELLQIYCTGHQNADGQGFSSKVGAVISAYCNAGKFEEVKTFLVKIGFNPNNFKWAWTYGDISRAAAVCLNKGVAKEYTEYFNDLSLKVTGKFLKMPKPNPNWLTSNQFMIMKNEFASGGVYPTAVRVYQKYKSSKEALALAEEGLRMSSFSSELKKLYILLLVDNGRAPEALKMLDELIIAGDKKEDVMKTHKTAYEKVNSGLEGYDTYLNGLTGKAISIIKEKIKNSIISKPAPQFTLKDIDGKKVSLSDYKGKTVILDFWATWCSPCKASFPSMKKAQEKYASNQGVKFLFVNTMERVENPAENAANFIRANNYPFHVVVDAEGKISASYDVSGIPTKIFIDKEGEIRYIAVGFEEATLQEEIDTVINLIK